MLPSGSLKTILVLLSVGLLAWTYQSTQPPRPNTCGSPGGPPVTAPRIKLSDGRYLAYKESGVPRETAKYKIIHVHGYNGCRNDIGFFSQEFAQELGIYLVSFDRAGYGESDPDPRRSVKSTPSDMEELADQLGLGSKFYVTGLSMGGQVIWGCLKFIPHRLLGAALLAPAINYWWPGFPANLSIEVYNQLPKPDKWTLRVIHYVPRLTYWWNSQKWFPSLSITNFNPEIFSPPDKAVIFKHVQHRLPYMAQVRQQGEYGSLHQDLMVGFGRWEFDPMDLRNPFPNNEGSVHLWQGDEDWIIQVTLQRYIAEKLPWIHYHELKGAGHFFLYGDGANEAVLKALLLGDK